MWKLVIADDERLIMKGLKKLVDWESIDVEVVGDASDGEQLRKVIEYANPDIILTDIKMPYMNGLEVLHWYKEKNGKGKFIIISGYQEFSYAQEALKNGVVDYLLKPVGQRDLENAVKKAIQQLKEQNTVEIFSDKEDEFQKLFQNINDGRSYENKDLYQLFQAGNMDLEGKFFVGICAGICPDQAAGLAKESFSKFNLIRFSVFNKLTEAFSVRKLGFAIKKDENALNIMGIFPEKDRDNYREKYVEPIRKQMEEECCVNVCIGMGTPADQPSQMLNSYKTARVAFELYHFEEKKLIDIQEIHHDYNDSLDDLNESTEEVFRAVISKDEAVMEKINHVIDLIVNIHYGNWKAIIMRAMIFTGELGSRLDKYHFLDADFYGIQDELQKKVEDIHTVSALKQCIREHYEDLLCRVYKKGRTQDKWIIEDVKQYIRSHYAENLSIKELADVACVSQNYFSAMFKKETGQNYKAYLTGIRMEEALRLLQETDYKTYEIGEKVGYNNARRFVDAFKQIYSVSPMEYKKSLKREN